MCIRDRGYGKPYIVLAQKEQELPFDTYDDRAIFYDISQVPGLMCAQEMLEKFVGAIKAKGFIESEGPELSLIHIYLFLTFLRMWRCNPGIPAQWEAGTTTAIY